MADFSDAALAATRNYCGWHVTPVEEDTVTLDGPGGQLLVLPTLHLTELVSLTEDGTQVDVDDLITSPVGLVRKRSRGSWTRNYGAIVATFSHGFDEAADFDKAVTMVAESMGSTLRDDHSMILKRVDDVQYQWAQTQVESIVGTHLLAPYRLERHA